MTSAASERGMSISASVLKIRAPSPTTAGGKKTAPSLMTPPNGAGGREGRHSKHGYLPSGVAMGPQPAFAVRNDNITIIAAARRIGNVPACISAALSFIATIVSKRNDFGSHVRNRCSFINLHQGNFFRRHFIY